MAIYYLNIKNFGRSAGKAGSRATSAAAYRAGERIRDERTQAVYDHRRRQDVVHKEILLPADTAAAGRLDWARNRATLWNAAELAERRQNARVAREYTVALPHELSGAQRLELARTFARDLADRYRAAVDLVVHAPRKDARAHHAHLLTTTREVTAEGLGPKTVMELNDTDRLHRGLPRAREEVRAIRERWADMTNDALRSAGLAVRVNSVGHRAQGRELTEPWIPEIARRIEQRGGHSYVAERIRAQFARRQHLNSVLREHQRSSARTEDVPAARQAIEAIRAEARRNWLALRAGAAATPAASTALIEAEHEATLKLPELQRARSRERADDDLSL